MHETLNNIRQECISTQKSSRNPFNGFDHYFADFINSVALEPSTELYYASALSVHLLREGHIRFDLSKYAETIFSPDDTTETTVLLPKFDQWMEKLSKSGVTGTPGEYKPLILDNTNLYLYRYWRYEQDCAHSILDRIGLHPDNYTNETIRGSLETLFDLNQTGDDQLKAAMVALLNQFTVITGGPGTGKTTTVARIVAALLTLHQDRHYRIAVAAPTGKAAMRLGESLSHARTELKLDRLVAKAFPTQALTIHRLLGTIPGSTTFRHNKSNPLLYDLIVIDEASMIDIALMAKLLAAIPKSCRLILLGDKDQLASVEAGSVLGDICDTGIQHLISEPQSKPHAAVVAGTYPSTVNEHTLSDSITTLKRSFRFSGDSKIGILSKAINNGDYVSVLRTLDNSPDCTKHTITDMHQLRSTLAVSVHEWCLSLCKETDPQKALLLLDEFRILCALRQGTWGAGSVNSIISRYCATQRFVSQTNGIYNGLPIMILTNDYRHNLFNGDTGIIMEIDSIFFALFKSHDGSIRRLHLRLLPYWEVAYAITVHKSQGSEFTRTLLILPPTETPLLTRELLYTAITRARRSVEIWCSDSVLRKTVETVTDRSSGLRERLWKK